MQKVSLHIHFNCNRRETETNILKSKTITITTHTSDLQAKFLNMGTVSKETEVFMTSFVPYENVQKIIHSE